MEQHRTAQQLQQRPVHPMYPLSGVPIIYPLAQTAATPAVLRALVRIPLKTRVVVAHLGAEGMIDGIFGGGEAARSGVAVGVDAFGALELVGWGRGGEDVGVHAVG